MKNIFILLMLCPVLALGVKVSQYSGNVGKDPHAFEHADSMYQVAPVKKFDKTAAALLRLVQNRINARYLPEHRFVWDNLIKLNPYRTCAEVQNAIPGWAQKVHDHIKKGAYLTNRKMTQGNYYYKNGDFEIASNAYRERLRNCPADPDVRNNLALAQMHLKNDLVAQLEWEILRQDNEYIPAQINLTVLYERLGRTAEAESLAQKLADRRTDVPAAAFNAAWYENLAGDYAQAQILLIPLKALAPKGKFNELYGLNEIQLKFQTALEKERIYQSLPLYQKGLVSYVITKYPLARIYCYYLFAFYMIILLTRIGKNYKYKKNGAKAAWHTYFIVCGLSFLIVWGLPIKYMEWLILLFCIGIGSLWSKSIAAAR